MFNKKKYIKYKIKCSAIAFLLYENLHDVLILCSHYVPSTGHQYVKTFAIRFTSMVQTSHHMEQFMLQRMCLQSTWRKWVY